MASAASAIACLAVAAAAAWVARGAATVTPSVVAVLHEVTVAAEEQGHREQALGPKSDLLA